jgi:putative ABC transport system ATP-binding protein
MDLIIAENLYKDYQIGEIIIPALKDINFTIGHGAFISFVGPSGSGKTTLLNLIGCLDKPGKGKLQILDTDVISLSQKEKAIFRGNNIGFIFQDFNLVPVLTVYENVEYPLIMVQSIPLKERQKRVLSILDSVGMIKEKDKYPSQISGGQKQRVAIARALVIKPRLVLADEPTANLDHKTAFTVISLMKKIKDEMNTTFIFSTHDMKIVSEAETIYHLEDGELKNKETNEGAKNVAF